MHNPTTIIKTSLLGILLVCCMACNRFDIDKAKWVQLNYAPFIKYTVQDPVSPSKTGYGKLALEFYGWEKKGTIVAAYASDEMKNFIELIIRQLNSNTSLQQLGKKSKGFVRFDVDQYTQTTGVFESGIPIFSFTVK